MKYYKVVNKKGHKKQLFLSLDTVLEIVKCFADDDIDNCDEKDYFLYRRIIFEK